MSDEGFHEIQLNGKQLVFLFMAATVVSVVIFLCGVMVGRGVRAPQTPAEASQVGPMASVDEAPADSSVPPADPAPAPAAQPASAPPEPAEGGGYYDQLVQPEGEKEPRVAPTREPERRAERRPTPEPEPPAASPPSAVASGGFVVQIAALRDRREADAIVRRLSGKGYGAFVVNPVPGAPPVYKVQVGRFAERAEADRVAARLRTEEQFSPWVTR